MSLDDYRPLLAERNKVRAQYAKLSAAADGCISLAAPDTSLGSASDLVRCHRWSCPCPGISHPPRSC